MQSLFSLHLLGSRSDWVKLRFLHIIFGGNKMIENKESHPIKVVIVDDHPIVRKGLKALFKTNPFAPAFIDCSTYCLSSYAVNITILV